MIIILILITCIKIDQQKVVSKKQWKPKPRNQRQFRNLNRNSHNRLSQKKRGCVNSVKMNKNINLPDEEVLVVSNDSISPVDKMLLKRLWKQTDGNYCEDFDYMFANYRADVFTAIKDKLSIEGSNGKKRRKLGLAQLAMNPNYVYEEAQLTPKEMSSMSAIYPHKINRDSYEDVPTIECAYMAGSSKGSFGDFANSLKTMTQQAPDTSAVMEVTASTKEHSTQQGEDESRKNASDDEDLNQKPAASIQTTIQTSTIATSRSSDKEEMLESTDSLENILEDDSEESKDNQAIK